MRKLLITAIALLGFGAPSARAYVEVPHSLGRCVHESTVICLVEVTRVSSEKNLIIYKKLADIKGKFAQTEIKHNIGKKGFHEREWKNVMQWAEVGKKAVFMANNDASETCIGTYWYQAYREGEWWGMSHAEPFLLRTFYGDPEKLADLCTRIVKGEEVIAPCLADGDKNQLHQRKGKLQRLKASLKKLDYNAKRDFVGWGVDGEDSVDEFKTIDVMKESTAGWRFLPAKEVKGNEWIQPNFDDAKWRKGKAPLGHGEPEIANRKGTEISEKGESFVFRRDFDLPAELLTQKDAIFHLGVASDDFATVYINGQLVDKDAEDHEFAYWNRDVEVPVKVLKPGRNVIAALVANKPASSDIFLDMEFNVQVPLPKKKKMATVVVTNPKDNPTTTEPKVQPEPRDPNAISIDKSARTIAVACEIAPRKLPNLDQQYPIEVIATWASPRGQKAHETVVVIKGVWPSDVQKALEDLGVKPGKPAYGDGPKGQGPEVKIFLEFAGADGKPQRHPFDKLLVNTKDAKPVPELKWQFTGSVMKEPDPEKPVQVFGADLTGTFLSIFPVTDCCLFQSQLTMKEEAQLKLEINDKLLPKQGTVARLIIQVP